MTRISLALGAGGARGLAHVHAVHAFEDLGLRPQRVAGTSIGSIIGACVCAGLSARDIVEHIDSKIGNRLTLLSELFKVRPASLDSFLSDGGLRLGELNLERILEVFLPDSLPVSFAGLDIPLKIAATDYYAQKTEVFDSGPLLSAMAASAAMPAVFLPVERQGRFFIDGSATSPCPLDLLQGSAEHIIAIDVSGGSSGDPAERPKKIDAIYAANQMMQMSIVQHAAAQSPNTVLLRPPVDSYRSLDFLKAQEILEQTAPLREAVKREIDGLMARQDTLP